MSVAAVPAAGPVDVIGDSSTALDWDLRRAAMRALEIPHTRCRACALRFSGSVRRVQQNAMKRWSWYAGDAQSPDPLARMHTMTERKGKSGTIDVKALLAGDEEFLRALVRAALQEVLEVEMTEALGAEKSERTAGRLGYRSGYYGRTLITRIGKLELRVPQDRAGRFSTELFERYQRSERALVAALAEMYVQGVSTRKVKAITEELCGHSFSASAISAINQRLDASLAQFTGRPLAEAFPYLIFDARYERVREAGVITSQAVLIAIGIDWDGRRQVLAVELANRESRSNWRDFLLGLKARGLHGVEFVVPGEPHGPQAATREVLAEAAYQRCYVHFLRNALDHVPRKVDDDCLQELRWLYDRRDLTEARRDLAPWLAKWSANTQSSPAGSKTTST